MIGRIKPAPKLIVWALDENNSGGHFRITKEQFDKLLANGWYFEPSEYQIRLRQDKAPANRGATSLSTMIGGPDRDTPVAYRNGAIKFKAATQREAIDSFEAATGLNYYDAGCPCCGDCYSIYEDYTN